MRIYNQIAKKRKWGLILFFFISFSLKAQQIQFLNCDNNNPITDLFVFSENGKYIGVSDSNGICKIVYPISMIKIIGLNINDTIISIKNVTTICLNTISYNLQEFRVGEEHIEVKNLFIKMLEDSWDIMLKKDTTFYYNFEYTITIPDSNWNETISGVLKVHTMLSIEKMFPLFPMIYYAKINYMADDNFLKSPIYEYSTTKLFQFMNIPNDLMFRRREHISKDVNRNIKNISLNPDSTQMTFSMDRSNKQIKVKQKTYFQNNLITKNELYSIEENKGNGLNNYYLNSAYTPSTNGKLLSALYLKNIVQKKGTFFVIKFEVFLMKEAYHGESLNAPINILLNYQKWLKTQNKQSK